VIANLALTEISVINEKVLQTGRYKMQ